GYVLFRFGPELSVHSKRVCTVDVRAVIDPVLSSKLCAEWASGYAFGSASSNIEDAARLPPPLVPRGIPKHIYEQRWNDLLGPGLRLLAHPHDVLGAGQEINDAALLVDRCQWDLELLQEAGLKAMDR